MDRRSFLTMIAAAPLAALAPLPKVLELNEANWNRVRQREPFDLATHFSVRMDWNDAYLQRAANRFNSARIDSLSLDSQAR